MHKNTSKLNNSVVCGWIVQNTCGISKWGAVQWDCSCVSCGNTHIFISSEIKKGNLPSCKICQLPKNVKNIKGEVFEKWIVVSYAGTIKSIKDGIVTSAVAHWNCLCECGNLRTISGGHLRNGASKSCGCYKPKAVESGRKRRIKGKWIEDKISPEYAAWNSMKDRCLNKKNNAYLRYGGRGILICSRWLGKNGFQNFLCDMGRKPNIFLTLERVNNNDGYSPNNCIWATRKEQSRNTRYNRIMEMDGRKMCVSEWAEEYNISVSLLFSRLNLGWDLRDALFRSKKGQDASNI